MRAPLSGLVACGFAMAVSLWWSGHAAELDHWLMLGVVYLGLVLVWFFVLPHVDGAFRSSRKTLK